MTMCVTDVGLRCFFSSVCFSLTAQFSSACTLSFRFLVSYVRCLVFIFGTRLIPFELSAVEIMLHLLVVDLLLFHQLAVWLRVSSAGNHNDFLGCYC